MTKDAQSALLEKKYAVHLTQGEIGFLTGLAIKAFLEDEQMARLYHGLRDELSRAGMQVLQDRAQAASRGA